MVVTSGAAVSDGRCLTLAPLAPFSTHVSKKESYVEACIRPPLVVASLFVVAAAAVVGKDVVEFRVRDDCDPATFNAAIGEGTCVERFDGGTTFEEFLEELGEDGEVGSWKFNPDDKDLDRGQGTVLRSRAGEFHTFTRVAEFGGGIVGVLNDIGGFGDTVTECRNRKRAGPPKRDESVRARGRARAGPVAGKGDMPKGTTKWQCCIHPWMRSTVTVR